MKYQIQAVEDIYTGGGIYIFVGTLADGKGFLADGDMFDVRLFNEMPGELSFDNCNLVIDSVEWQEEHLYKDLDTEREGPRFICSVIEHIRKATNNRYDGFLDIIYDDAKKYIGERNWR